MNKYILKLSFFLFVSILFCGIFFSCEKDDNTVDDTNVFDLSEKGKVTNKTVSLDLDGTELIMDSCRMEYTCFDGYILTSYQKNTDNKLVIRWHLDDDDIKIDDTKAYNKRYLDGLNILDGYDVVVEDDTFKVYNKGRLNGLDILLDDYKPNGKIAIRKLEIKRNIDVQFYDSIFVEGVFHTKIYDNNIVKNVKGQFSYKGLVAQIIGCL